MARRNVPGHARGLLAHFVFRDFNRRPHIVEPAREAEQRAVAAFAHAVDDRADAAIQRAVSTRVASEEPVDGGAIRGVQDPEHHSTILLSGYSTMPWARAPA